MARNQKPITLRKTFVLLMSVLVGAIVLLTAYVVAMGAIYGKTQNQVVLVLLVVITLLGVLALGAWLFFVGRNLRKNYVESMLDVTMHNYQTINAGSAEIKDYPAGKVAEFEEMNTEVRAVRSSLRNATFIFSELHYDNFELVPIEGYPNVYELEGFQKQLSSIIAASMNFRNVLAQIYFELGEDDSLKDDELAALCKEIQSRLSSYQDMIILFPKDRKSLYVYLPRIDSFTAVSDVFSTFITTSAISRTGVGGHMSLMPHYSIVAYPFSAVHELFPDLRYARRQNKLANLYLPNRLHSLGEANINKNAMHFNQMSRILFNIASIESTSSNKQDVRKSVANILQSICSELNFEMAGIIAYDQEVGGFIVKDHVGSDRVLSIGKVLPDEFVLTLASSADADHSFFFSSRAKASKEVGKVADRLGFSSGFLYALQKEGKPHGIIYFLNTKDRSNLNSYLQEALSAACYHLSSSFAFGEVVEESVEAHRQFEALLSSSDSAYYRIEKGSHRLLNFSRGLVHTFPLIKEGELCHKVMYGLASPCPDCPLTSGKKKISQVKKHTYTTALTLDVRRGSVHTLLFQRQKVGEEDTNRYDNELLISSFPTLLSEVRSHYLVGDNGYVLILRIANHARLLAQYGSEGFLLILRNFIDAMRKIAPQYDNLFRYDDKSLALLLPAVGQVDVINRCEEIYRLTKDIVYEGAQKYSLDIDYMPMNYPQGYAGAEDYFRHVSRDLSTRKLTQGHDFIYFDDTDYVRPASRRDFMLSVIEEQFGKEAFGVELQPMVEAKTKKVFGAEILLRIQDEYRHIVFRPDELVRVAAENGKIPLITRALLRYVANFYESVGAATFKATGFRRLALNTDVSLFTDPTFENDFAALLKRTDLPKGFIAFEIAEGDCAAHLEEFAAATKMLKKFDIQLVVDQYSGRQLSIDDLARLGFDKVKVGRNVVHNIDTDQGKLAGITNLLNEAKAKGIDAAIVGVENIDQYNLLNHINPNLEMQGYYFYKPLERAALLEAMRSNKSK